MADEEDLTLDLSKKKKVKQNDYDVVVVQNDNDTNFSLFELVLGKKSKKKEIKLEYPENASLEFEEMAASISRINLIDSGEKKLDDDDCFIPQKNDDTVEVDDEQIFLSKLYNMPSNLSPRSSELKPVAAGSQGEMSDLASFFNSLLKKNTGD